MKKTKTYLQLMKGYLGKRAWKKLTPEMRKELRDLARLQQKTSKYFRKFPKEEYVNMNAEIEYLKSIGQH
jgi:hypothetical protein